MFFFILLLLSILMLQNRESIYCSEDELNSSVQRKFIYSGKISKVSQLTFRSVQNEESGKCRLEFVVCCAFSVKGGVSGIIWLNVKWDECSTSANSIFHFIKWSNGWHDLQWYFSGCGIGPSASLMMKAMGNMTSTQSYGITDKWLRQLHAHYRRMSHTHICKHRSHTQTITP